MKYQEKVDMIDSWLTMYSKSDRIKLPLEGSVEKVDSPSFSCVSHDPMTQPIIGF